MKLMKFIRKKKGSAIYSFMILVGAFLVLTWAYAVITSDEFMNRPPEEKVIGSKQARLFSIYQQGEDMLLYLDFAARYTAFQSIYDLATTGGYYGESECGRFKGYTIWKLGSVEPYCYPEMGVISEGYQKYFNRSFGPYLRKLDNSFTNFTYYVSASGGEETTISGAANKRILMVMPYDASEKIDLKLGEQGSYISSWGAGSTYDGQCSYCGVNTELLKQWDPDSYCGDTCCRGMCPPDSYILPVPFQSQCTYPSDQDNKYCYNSCGPTSMLMALRYYKQVQDVSINNKFLNIGYLWNNGNCASTGSNRGCHASSFAVNVGTDAGLIVSVISNPSFEEFGSHVKQDNPVIVWNSLGKGDDERCEDASFGHFFLLVGVSDKYAIVNEPYVMGCNPSFGDHLVLNRATFMNMCIGCYGWVIKE